MNRRLESAIDSVGFYFEKHIRDSMLRYELNDVCVIHKTDDEWVRFMLKENPYAPNGYTIRFWGPNRKDLNDPKGLAGLGHVCGQELYFEGFECKEHALLTVRIFFK